MNMASGQQQENNDVSDTIVSQYTKFCRNLCKAITATGDVELAWLFIIRYFDRVQRKGLLADFLGELLEKLGWIAVHEPITNAINRMAPFEAMEFVLEMTEYLSDEDAVSTMRLLAVSKAQQIPILALAASRSIGQLWKAATRFKDKSLFPVIESLFQRMETDAIGPVVGVIARTVDTSTSPEGRAVSTSLLSRRRRWLQDEVSRLKSWEMPEAEFPGHAGVEAFLRGPKASFVISGFSDIMGAEKFITYHQSQTKQSVSYIMTAHGSGMNAIVIVTKTREHHHPSKHELDELTAELTRLAQICPLASAGVEVSGYKRPRTETSSDEPSGSKQRRERTSEDFMGSSGSLMQAKGMPASDGNVPPSA